MTDALPSQLKPDFISCAICGSTYPAYRSSAFPHPILQIPISRQIAVQSLPVEKGEGGWPLGIEEQIGAVPGTAIAIIPKKKRRPKPKPGPRILVEPYYQQQEWEKRNQGWKRWRAFSLWLELDGDRSYAEVGRRLGYSDSDLIERWANQDKWKLRLEAFLEDRAKAEREELKKEWKRRFGRVKIIGDSILTILAAEADARLRDLRANAGSMSVKELNDSYIALGKFFELLQGRPTEHVMHDTPEMRREKMMQDAINSIREQIAEFEKAHTDESLRSEGYDPQEQRMLFTDLYIDTQVKACPQLDAKQLREAVLGRVDDTSTATN